MKLKLKLGWIGLFVIFFRLTAFSQNPFDIKSPNKDSKAKEVPVNKQATSTNTVNPAQEKPKESNTQSTPISIAPQKTNQQVIAPVTPPPIPSTTNPAVGNNPFDIKVGTENKSVINNPTNINPGQSNTIPIPSNTRTNNSNTETKPTDTKILDGVENPFVIKPGVDPKNPTSANDNVIPIPKIEDIKEQITELGITTAQRQSKISKNMWFVIFLFLFLLAAIAINFNRNFLFNLIKATYNQNQMRMLFKELFKSNHVFIFGLLYFLFIMNAGIFLYHAFQLFSLASLSLLQAIGIVFIVYLIRHIVLFVLGVIFPLSKSTDYFSYTIGIYNTSLGLALMIINVILSFVDIETGKMLVFSGLSLILALYIMRQLRGLLSNMQAVVSAKFHFIIYLCTVEIAPWLLLSGILVR